MGLSVFDLDEVLRAVHDRLRGGEDRATPEEVYAKQLVYAKERATKGYCEKDLWDIESWFLRIMAGMLAEFKIKRHGSPQRLGENYVNEQGFLVNDTCHAEWDGILDEMVRLFRESVEETCSRKNPYEAEHAKAYGEFTERYGPCGERLDPEPASPDAPCRRMHFLREVPEYAEIDRKWEAAERELEEYRAECRREALAMFGTWLPDLVD